jgi:hypothetical protein
MIREYRPFFREKGGVNYDYGQDFEKWFNDRFNKREEILSFYRFVQFNINVTNKDRISNKHFYGQDNWMFYRGDFDIMTTIEHYQNIELFTQEQLEKISAYLQSVNDWCEQNKKKFYFFMVPDKHRIYGENFPFYVKKIFPDEQGKTYQLIAYLKKHTTVKVIYPDKILAEHKKEGLLYWKTDTHWNEMGAYWSYIALMQEISKDFNLEPFIVSNYKTLNHRRGDLRAVATDKYIDEQYIAPDIEKYYTKNQHPEADFFENRKGKYSLVLFGDSFSRLLSPYLGNTFRKVLVFNIYGINNNLEYAKNTQKKMQTLLLLKKLSVE